MDALLLQSRLMDSYSVKTNDVAKELGLEIYRVVPLPAECKAAPSLRVVLARSGDSDVPTGPVQAVIEETPRRRFLHVRVPLKVRAVDPLKMHAIISNGIKVDLEGDEWVPRSAGISRESFVRIKLGMTREKVRGIIGRSPGSYLTNGKETTRKLKESDGDMPKPFAAPHIWCGNASDLLVDFDAHGRVVRKELYLDPKKQR